ncbi:MAG: MoxR family ATPase [Desulfocapsaceae bacterium]|jgi:MoxR-like ATPase|nr:MoxR family ATPase [Desulfocapsaceae bacterium]
MFSKISTEAALELRSPMQGNTYETIQAITAEVAAGSSWVSELRDVMQSVVIGQDHLLDSLFISLLTGGHILLEGLPGLAKTLAVKTLAQAINTDFKRIQFTPDMLPADIIGTELYNPRDTRFEVKKGPIFSSLVLADEINRAPAKVQSALLEAMQEKQVTIGDTTFELPELFLVLATQNPIEQEGTYPLPEAQIDRFMLKVTITYPSAAEERLILDSKNHADSHVPISPVTHVSDIFQSRAVVETIYIDDKIKDYIVSLVCASRDPQTFGLDLADYIESGASPRATLNLKSVSRSRAYLAGRGYVTPDDVKLAASDVMKHRIRISYEAEAESITSEDIIRKILDSVPVP